LTRKNDRRRVTVLDHQLFVKGITMLCEVYGRTQSKLLLEAYYRVLGTMSDEEFELAVTGLMGDRTFLKMPLPAEIKQYGKGDSGSKALLAYHQVIAAVRHYGGYKSIIFEDRTTMAVVEHMGGWIRLCDATIDEWTWLAKDFVKYYGAFDGRGMEAPGRLPGIHEQTSVAKGLLDEPVQAVTVQAEVRKLASPVSGACET
jgi:hypothetical protein